jgi:hypothetical protein
MRRKKLNSKNVDDLINGALLDRLLDGEALVQASDGAALTGSNGKEMTRSIAIGKVCGMIAFKLDEPTPFEGVQEILRPSLWSMLEGDEVVDDLMKQAETNYYMSLKKKIEKEKEDEEKEKTIQQARKIFMQNRR